MSKKHILWCKEGIHDKVWGIICLQEYLHEPDYLHNVSAGKFLTFWGRRGKKLQTLLWEGTKYKADEMARKKLDKGYVEIDQNHLDRVYPEFQQDLEKTEIWAKLKL